MTKSRLIEIEDAIELLSKVTKKPQTYVRPDVFAICNHSRIRLFDRFGQSMKWFPDLFHFVKDESGHELLSFRRGFHVDVDELMATLGYDLATQVAVLRTAGLPAFDIEERRNSDALVSGIKAAIQQGVETVLNDSRQNETDRETRTNLSTARANQHEDNNERNNPPRIGWKRALSNEWPGICKLHGPKATARQAIDYLKKHDTSGSILNDKGGSGELWWRLETGEAKEVSLGTVRNFLTDLRKHHA